MVKTDGEDRQQIYVEADAKMDTYEAQDPNDANKRVVRTQLNLLMRMSLSELATLAEH